jgi:hypothetical protein
MLGDALRLIHERLTEAEAVGEVDYRGKRVAGSGTNEQGVGGPVGCANLERLFNHACDSSTERADLRKGLNALWGESVKQSTLKETLMKHFRFAGMTAVVVANALSAGIASSQQAGITSSERHTQTIVASFNKSKHVVKEKYGVRKEKYLDVRSVPAVKQNPADYSGAYEVSDLRFSLELRVDATGRVEGSGYEPLNDDAAVSRTFTLKDGRMTGALLRATKVYGNGSSEPFEGVFINRTVIESPTDKGVTAFGLGVVSKQFQMGGLNLDRLFYQLKQPTD